jgi:DNA-binding response OmpR family regulator
LKILVADDDAVSRALLAKVLPRLGHDVVMAADGDAAWDLFQSSGVECVVTDWSMPGLSGLDLCRRVRGSSERPWAYLLLLTGKDRKEDLVEGILAGADEFMTKPFDAEVLRARLHAADRVLRLEHALAQRVQDLETALDEVKTLRGLLPICMYCKKIRDEQDWEAVEQYVARHSDAQFSHGICPTCHDQVVKPMLAQLRAEAVS